MPDWHRLVVLGCVLLVTAVVARLVDRRIARRDLPPEAQTRYRVLRRSITASLVFIGLVSALLVIPQVRAVAGGLLASSAVLGLVIGFAARSTLANWVAGLLIALAQPIRLGDLVCIDGEYGTVEEIGLTYTRIRTDDLDRLVIPNEKLASDTDPQLDDRQREKLAEITVQVPLTTELGPLSSRPCATRSPDERSTEVLRHRLADKATRDRARLGRRRGEGRRATSPTSASACTSGCVPRGLFADGPETAAPDRPPERRPAPQRLRQRARRRRRRRCGRRSSSASPLSPAGVLIAAGFGGARSPSAPAATLSSLRPVCDRPELVRLRRRRRRCSARSRPSENRQPVPLCAGQPLGAQGRRSRSRTAASTSTAASTTRASRARSCATSSAGKVVEGGSTITQQLVRNLYIGRERTLKRKVKEACLAIKLSTRAGRRTGSSPTYLNQVYYGNHAYGIEAASQTYFSRPAKKLTLVQAALLAGLPQAPSRLRPVHRRARRRSTRRNEVLQRDARERRHRPARVPGGGRDHEPAPEARAASTRRSASRTSSATCATS